MTGREKPMAVMNSSRWIMLLLLFLTFFSGHHTSYAQSQLSGIDINSIAFSVVQISSRSKHGSGSIIKGTNLILTNRHIVENNRTFIVSVLQDINMPARPAYLAELVAFSDYYDLAILRVFADLEGRLVSDEELSGRFPVLSYMSAGAAINRGDEIAVLGYPSLGGGELIYTTGIVASVNYDRYKGRSMPFWYRTNAEMSPGNSGGIAVNKDGQVIGLPTYVAYEGQTGGRLGSILSIQLIFDIIEEEDLVMVRDGRYANERSVSENVVRKYSEQLFDTRKQTEGLFSEPLVIPVVSGGSINTELLGGDCTGYVSETPDYSFQWNGGASALVFTFVADNPEDDATMLVGMPAEVWYCNDDGFEGTLNPMVIIDQPDRGQYDIWLGSYSKEEFISGKLYIVKYEPDIQVTSSKEGKERHILDYSYDPSFSTINLQSGFAPDPYEIRGQSGGTVSLSLLDLGSGCMGYASTAPDFRLNWKGSTKKLRVLFIADNPDEDALLIINTPNGSWVCNDDANTGTLNPMIDLGKYPEGQFDIWIGSYLENSKINGKLIITERNLKP